MKRFILGAVQIVAIVAFVVTVFYFSRAPSVEDIQAQEGELGRQHEGVNIVNVYRPIVETVQLIVKTTGIVTARNEIAIVPQVSGRIEWISPVLRAGGAFAEGEVLFRIEAVDYELAVAQAEANLNTARANLELREAERAAAQENWNLLHPEEPVPVLVSKLPQIRQSEAGIQVAKAQLDVVALELSRTKFSLPFKGYVADARVGIGQLVSRGQSLGTVYNDESLEVRVPLSDREVELIGDGIGNRAEVHWKDKIVVGRVDRISSTVDFRTRARSLFLTFATPVDLVPGNFVEVELYGRHVEQVFQVPLAAEQTNSRFWVVREESLAVFEPTIVARQQDELIVHVFDFGSGIVIGPVANAFPGMQVDLSADSL